MSMPIQTSRDVTNSCTTLIWDILEMTTQRNEVIVNTHTPKITQSCVRKLFRRSFNNILRGIHSL